MVKSIFWRTKNKKYLKVELFYHINFFFCRSEKSIYVVTKEVTALYNRVILCPYYILTLIFDCLMHILSIKIQKKKKEKKKKNFLKKVF